MTKNNKANVAPKYIKRVYFLPSSILRILSNLKVEKIMIILFKVTKKYWNITYKNNYTK